MAICRLNTRVGSCPSCESVRDVPKQLHQFEPGECDRPFSQEAQRNAQPLCTPFGESRRRLYNQTSTIRGKSGGALGPHRLNDLEPAAELLAELTRASVLR